MPIARHAALAVPLVVLAGCGGDNTASRVQPPGAPPGGKTQLLEAGTALLQKKTPVGHPMLMAGFTADGQADPRMVDERDRRFGVSTAERREARRGIVAPDVLPGANAWEQGETLQLALERLQPGTAAVGHGLPEDAAPDGSAAPARP